MEGTFRLAAVLLTLGISAPVFAQPIQAVVKLKERTPIETLARNVLDPASPRYGKFYTPAEIRDLAGPSDADYAKTLAQLRQQGFQIAGESPTHLWVTVRADEQVFERAFGTHLEFLKSGLHRPVGMHALSTARFSPMIESVTGLDNTRKLHPKFVRMTGIQDSPGGIAPETIKSAYSFDAIYKSGITGKGQDIAIATYDGFHIDDVKQFYTLTNLAPGPTVDQVKFNGDPAVNDDSAMETELDAEFSGMMAPGASVHVFASATNDDAGELQMFTAILDDNRAKVVNYSWGDCEKNITDQHKKDMDKVFLRAVAQGVNIMVASGDSGSDSCQDGSTVADWPAAHSGVIAVGGTTFGGDTSSPNETAWSGSGGGISGIWALPSYQSGLGAPYDHRSYPDVAFNADPASGQAIYTQQYGSAGWMVIGGTSMAAPQWSGFLALVGEARAKAGKSPVGFLNPVLYAMSADQRAKVLNDVTSGNNGAYKAGTGWDAVTGFGSMQASALLKYLAQH